MVVWNRRHFMRFAAVVSAAASLPGLNLVSAQEAQEPPTKPIAANDHIQIALIGAGGQGMGDTEQALKAPGVKLVAVADCYTGRLERSKENWGKNVFTTRDYNEILARKDIDAVIVATPDHWHKQASVDAMKAGIDVYCEKPMIHEYADGPEMIQSAQETKRILQVGSQRVSNPVYAKAKEMIASGAIGKLNMVSAYWDRSSAQGAWDYTVPPDASTETCDWERFQGTAPKIPFNAEHFFQWRKWKAYGTGVTGDLFVHLFSGTHFITGSHGPTRGMASGAIRYWKDGRDANDVVMGIFDYPEGFNLSLHVNFAHAGMDGEGLTFIGDEGSIEVYGSSLKLHHVKISKAPGYSVRTFPEAMQKKILADYKAKYPSDFDSGNDERVEKWNAPSGSNDHRLHLANFIHSVRTRQQPVEDATFGYRAAGAALLSNLSIDRGQVVNWDPEAMKLL